MAPVFSKEAILQGPADHLCLVCEAYLRTRRDVAAHVAQAGHRDSLLKSDYLEKYRSDRIRKVKKWYFCEFCNILLTTGTKVGLHVGQPIHNQNKRNRMITREGDTVAVGEDIVIHDDVWHGLLDNTCALCNTEFENKDAHKLETTHVINLIQSRVCEVNNNIYRQVDSTSVHCLTCNKLVANINTHIDETKHKNLVVKCLKLTSEQQNVIKEETPAKEYVSNSVNMNYIIDEKENTLNIVNNQNEKNDNLFDKIKEDTSNDRCDVKIDQDEVNDHLESVHHQGILKMHLEQGEKLEEKKESSEENYHDTTNDLSSDILELIPKFQKENININLETRTAVCRKCSNNLEYNTKDIENHIAEHKKNPQKKNGEKTSIAVNIDELKPRDSTKLLTSPVFCKHETKNDENNATNNIEQKEEENTDIKKAAENKGLTYYSNGNKVYCQQCNKHIPSSVTNINEHVNGAIHNSKSNSVKVLKDNETPKTPKKCNLSRVPLICFVNTLIVIDGKDLILNKEYCVALESFEFLEKVSQSLFRCRVCEQNVLTNPRIVKLHVDTGCHERAVQEVPLVIHDGSEFIREVRSGLFHCGFCNRYEPSWEQMEEHLTSTLHAESKASANCRLLRYMPRIERHELEREINDHMQRVFLAMLFGVNRD